MFEQSSYSQKPVEKVQTHEGDLFHNYEIKNWELSPYLYKILAMSAGLNVLAILVVSQTSLLTMKGCDSPLVGRVCQVLDTMYVGTMLFGTDREYADAVYEKTDLADADITFVDVSGLEGPMDYPTSFVDMNTNLPVPMFPQAAVDPMMAFNESGITPLPPDSQNNLLNTPPIPPPSNPNAVTGTIPDSPLAQSPDRKLGNARVPKGNITQSPKELPKVDDDATADANTSGEKPIASDTVPEVEINKKPLLDFTDGILNKWLNKEVDLNQPFTVVLDATLTKDGRFDKTKTKWDPKKQKGDPKMIAVAKEALEAVGDSGFLSYLRNMDVEKLTITIVQDENQVTAMISSSQKTPEQARTKSSGLNGWMTLGKLKVKNPSDERTLLDGAKVTAEGTNLIVNVLIPKPIAQEMMTRKLNEARAKKQQGQPTGDAILKPNDNTSKR